MSLSFVCRELVAYNLETAYDLAVTVDLDTDDVLVVVAINGLGFTCGNVSDPLPMSFVAAPQIECGELAELIAAPNTADAYEFVVVIR